VCELVVLMNGNKFFLLYRVKLSMVCHMYRFCVNNRKARQERNARFYSCYVRQK